MLTRRRIIQLRKALHRINVHKKPQNGKGETTPRKGSYSPNKLQHFRKIVLAMQEEALSVLRDCQDSVRSIENNQPSYGPREQPVSFNERSADAAVREEYALLIDRQTKLLGYLEAALRRIDEHRYGVCISCKELIARERLEAVPHTQLCLGCKVGRKTSVNPTRGPSLGNTRKRHAA
ncbi:MAG: TraR/DksA family transcriptional regulator [Bacteroidetes bacterium]|nr:TraR/DksA family transcriptional regulator [Bacteroidota bacterium]